MRLKILAPLRHRNFRLLFIGQAISMIGNQLYFVALPFQILALHGSPLQLGTGFAIFATAQLVTILFGGALVDRLPRRRVILTMDLLSTVVVANSAHAEKRFQKHNETTLSGKWKDRDTTLDEGTYIVRMDQPLARLAFYLLDPRSDDGLVEWNFFEDAPLPRKIMKRTPLVTTVVRAAE